MIKFSKKSQYGLLAMIYLAQAFKEENKYCSLKEISDKKNVSFSYLEKVLLDLEKANIIKSKKGPRGGYRLEEGPKKIRISEIINALEGSTRVVSCTNEGETCPRKENCKAIAVWQKVQKSLDETLKSITLNSLIKDEK